MYYNKEDFSMYYEKYGKYPSKNIFHEYFMLFESDETVINEKDFADKMKLCGNYEFTNKRMSENNLKFNNYEEFLKNIFKEYNNRG